MPIFTLNYYVGVVSLDTWHCSYLRAKDCTTLKEVAKISIIND